MKLFPHFVYISLIAIVSLLLTNCSSLLIEPDPSGSAEKNFEIFWSDIYNTYPYFNKDQVDWPAVYNTNRNKVTANTSDTELFYILRGMLDLLSDGHKSLISADKKLMYYPYRPNYKHNYDSLTVYRAYLHNTPRRDFATVETSPSKVEVVSDYGITDDSIIYYHVRTYLTKLSFENSFNLFSRMHPGAKGLILDLRNNTGGYISTMLNFMGIFFDRPTNYIIIKQKTGPLEEDFSAPENLTIRPSPGIPIFNRPIVVLTNRYTASAGEHTVLAMRLRNNTTIVGDTTLGAFSFVLERTLPNGMQFECVSSRVSDVNGTNFENTGIPPGIFSSLTTPGRDDLIDRALLLLNQ
jgi:carboxyl-terminal processing protease